MTKMQGVDRGKQLLAGGVCALALIVSTEATAQTDGQESASSASAAQQGDIIVTARNRSEVQMRVPETVSVVTADTLRDAGITDLSELRTVVPGFQQIRSQDPSNNLITIRGITQVRFGEPAVAYVVDGVQSASPDQVSQELFEVERVQVLKGPQGPTYGRNALGGAVVITTVPAAESLEANALAEYAEGPFYRFQGTVSGPLGKSGLLFQLSAGYREDKGLIRNVTTGENVDALDETTLRGRLSLAPGGPVELDIKAGHSKLEGRSGGYFPIFPGQNAEQRNPIVANRVGLAGRELTDASIRAEFDLGGPMLTSISAYAHTKASVFDQDIDFLPFPASAFFPGVLIDQTRSVKAWSQELRIASPDNADFSWSLGAYYLNTRRNVTTAVFLDLGMARGPRLSFLPERNNNNAYALFGSFAYRLADRVRLEFGLRQDWDARRQVNPATGSRVAATFKKLQPKASISYEAGDDGSIYLSAGRGFRSGGFNVQTPLFARLYPAETADTIEFGAKTRLMDRRLSLSGAFFYTNGRNVQTFQFDGATGTQGILTINETRFFGAESEARLTLDGGLSMWAGVILMDSKIRDFNGTASNRGNEIPLINHNSLNAGIQLRRPLFGNVGINASINYAGFGDLRWHVDNAPGERRGWVDLVDTRIALEGESWSLALFADNLFNEKFAVEFDAARFTGTPLDIAAPNPGRRIGIAARLKL